MRQEREPGEHMWVIVMWPVLLQVRTSSAKGGQVLRRLPTPRRTRTGRQTRYSSSLARGRREVEGEGGTEGKQWTGARYGRGFRPVTFDGLWLLWYIGTAD